MESIEKALNEHIISNINYFYQAVTEKRKSRWQGRILEDLTLAEEAGVLSYDDWGICMAIVFYIGTDFDMEDRLS